MSVISISKLTENLEFPSHIFCDFESKQRFAVVEVLCLYTDYTSMGSLRVWLQYKVKAGDLSVCSADTC